MDVKTLESLQVNKKIRLELEHQDIYGVLITENGSQWSGVFRGSLGKATIITKAFVSVGYVLVEQDAPIKEALPKEAYPKYPNKNQYENDESQIKKEINKDYE